MWLLDFPSLLIVIASGLYLGFMGIFGYAPGVGEDADWVRIAYLVAGAAGLWQLMRQRFV